MSELIPDYHLHSEFSGDCDTPVRDLIQALMAKGMTSACLTDHNDLDFPPTPENNNFNLDIDAYLKSLRALREELQPSFDLRIGLEQGVQPQTIQPLSHYSADHPGLDFIICSTHYVEHQDPYYPSFFEGRDPQECYLSYFREMLTTVQNFTDYSVYGHLDYIFRYGPGIKRISDLNLSARSDLKDLIAEILQEIIRHGKGIEINTGSLYRGLEFAHPHPDILKLYRDLGGTILTFGSDAHDTLHPGYHFQETAEMVKSLGFRYYCTYRKLQPEFHPL